MGPRCSWLFLFFLICVTDSIKGFSRRREYWSILLSICRVTYILRIYVRLVNYVEIPIVLLYLLRCLVYHMLSKTRRNSRSLHSDRCVSVVSTSMLGVSHAVQNEKKLWKFTQSDRWGMLGMLLVYKIPYDTSCILNTVQQCCIKARHDFGVCPSHCWLSGTP